MCTVLAIESVASRGGGGGYRSTVYQSGRSLDSRGCIRRYTVVYRFHLMRSTMGQYVDVMVKGPGWVAYLVVVFVTHPALCGWLEGVRRLVGIVVGTRRFSTPAGNRFSVVALPRVVFQPAIEV